MRTTYVDDIMVTTAIAAIDCAACGIAFGISAEFMQRRREDHREFYCPNGHSNLYRGKTEAEKLRQQLEASRSLAQREARRRETAERSVVAYKGVVTRTKRRISKGVCPAGCNRHFANLQAHIEAKHPEYTADATGMTNTTETA